MENCGVPDRPVLLFSFETLFKITLITYIFRIGLMWTFHFCNHPKLQSLCFQSLEIYFQFSSEETNIRTNSRTRFSNDNNHRNTVIFIHMDWQKLTKQHGDIHTVYKLKAEISIRAKVTYVASYAFLNKTNFYW